jgi:glutathione peroxidase
MKFLLAFLFAAVAFSSAAKEAKVQDSKLYSFVMKDITGKDKALSIYKGKALLLVNVASMCGNTPQYKDLEEIYLKYQKQGFEILGFPANNFGHQEPGTDAEIKEFCDTNFHVTFPLFSKIEVKGDKIHPLYLYLTTQTPFKGDIGWNFAKFLVARDGQVLARYSPGTQPKAKEIINGIEKALAAK